MKDLTQDTYDNLMLTIYDPTYTADSFYAEDSRRIQKVVRKYLAVDLSIVEAAKFWEDRSEQYDAGWLSVGSDEEIVTEFKAYIKRLVVLNAEPEPKPDNRSPEEIQKFMEDAASCLSERVWTDINGESILRKCVTVTPLDI